MAFMMPVVRNEWKVYEDGSRSRESKSRSRSRQNSECQWQSQSGSLSTSPKGLDSEPQRSAVNRSMALDIRPASKHRLSVGSLPSSFHSGHLSSSYGGSPRSSTSTNLSLSRKLLKSRFNKNLTLSEPPSPGKAVIVSPRSEDESPPKSGSQNSLQKFHARLVDRLRRSLRISQNDDNATAETGN